MNTPRSAVGSVDWIAERALRGASAADLVASVVAAGIEPADARARVAGVLGSPILATAWRLLGKSHALEQAAALRRAVDTEPVPELAAIDEASLHRDHWTTNRPLILRGAASAWPAARWTFPDLRARFAWAPVDVSVRAPRWWLSDRQVRRVPFGDLVDLALGPASDALYADGRSGLLDQAGLASMRADLRVLPGLVGDGHPRAWMGPRGTITPTHHDQASAWFVQLVGHKRLHLASPLEPTLAETTVGLFNAVDPTNPPAGAGARWHRVDLAPGDALFNPVGWWHHVEALEPSISVSFSGFRWPNDHGWYLPGRR